MRPQYHRSDGDNLAHYFIILTQRPVKFIVIVFEFIFLKQHYPSTIRNVHTHAILGKKGKRDGDKKEKRAGVKEVTEEGERGKR